LYQTSIKNWPELERPREKLLKKGPEYLSDCDLLAIILRTPPDSSTAEYLRYVSNRRGSVQKKITKFYLSTLENTYKKIAGQLSDYKLMVIILYLGIKCDKKVPSPFYHIR